MVSEPETAWLCDLPPAIHALGHRVCPLKVVCRTVSPPVDGGFELEYFRRPVSAIAHLGALITMSSDPDNRPLPVIVSPPGVA